MLCVLYHNFVIKNNTQEGGKMSPGEDIGFGNPRRERRKYREKELRKRETETDRQTL